MLFCASHLGQISFLRKSTYPIESYRGLALEVRRFLADGNKIQFSSILETVPHTEYPDKEKLISDKKAYTQNIFWGSLSL